MLRLLGGLDTPEIARAYLVPEATMAQRIVRAKRKLRDNHAPYRVPGAAELPARLHAVLTAVALIFTEGHTATSGDASSGRPVERGDPPRAGVVELLPDEPEAVGLLALMLLTDARRPAAPAADGTMVRLADQDRTLWDRDLIAEGHALVRACLRRNRPGRSSIQAAIAAVHADAPTAAATDWDQIVALYDQLAATGTERRRGAQPGGGDRRARRRRAPGSPRSTPSTPTSSRLPAVPRRPGRPARPRRPRRPMRCRLLAGARAHHQPSRAPVPPRSACRGDDGSG